ncbi:hypothetical protein H6G17_07910 [Chroococcidiopsis sp. FACHB-1243]|uniref:hypothetical protein n=1 Tax=Chroococcidiopsis sp. [FACHB-1243] TaxID=2692781 RepID=UPI00178116CD|nr:hypothetical protein [Chroococcidiopsis sp. [FACHB-1243]]MBD2305436.1 hypothetical protein [Chroococcidiopsis sp. [FACHB-1243]]
MDISNLSLEQKKTVLAKAPFPYNHPELIAQYRGKNMVVVDDQFLGILGEIDFKAIQKHYREQGKEPVIICVPPN